MLVENEPVPLDRRAWMECRSLVRAGYTVSVICPQGETRDREPYVKLDGVDIYRYPPRMSAGGARGYLVEYGSALLHMRRLARRLSASAPFDVAHLANPPDVLFLAVLFLRRRGVRFVFDHHDLVPELYSTRFGRRRGLLYRLAVRFERLTMRIAHVVVAPNDSYRRIAVGRGRKALENTFVVRNAPDDLVRFSPGEPHPALKRGKRFLIAYLGVIGPQDGVDHARVEAASCRAPPPRPGRVPRLHRR
ncbi:MAG: glycosyltransferase WbuB [Thermoleophilia bacterium]|nr:glycosyltransferase WbuB [Thermoleophilia bacterium]